MKIIDRFALTTLLAVAAIAAAGAARPATKPAPPPEICPLPGWAEGLGKYLQPDFPFPTSDTRVTDPTKKTPDCNFHQWSWEAFVWATALVKDPASDAIVPRFMTFATPADLQSKDENAGEIKLRPLTLAARAQVFHDAPGFTEGAGAIVEADGNMLVAQNGYPVYASVHMNPTYFNTARKNLIATGDYQKGSQDASFNTGDAVFKATWLRLDSGQTPPAGAYVTEAQVPVLQNSLLPGQIIIQPVPGEFVTAKVALIGLHVVGSTDNHPEFIWGTFELKGNSPQTADNTFKPSPNRSDPKTYTLYKGGTPFSNVNIAALPGANRPQLKLDPDTQKLTPVTNVLRENQTGGENQPSGVQNIVNTNTGAQGFLSHLKGAQSTFANYSLDGTVWLPHDSYNPGSNETNALGSVNLANTTAETFFQRADNASMKKVRNCFSCHNPTSYSFKTPPPALPNRLIALSHVLAVGTVYEVPNSISGKLPLVPDVFRGE